MNESRFYTSILNSLKIATALVPLLNLTNAHAAGIDQLTPTDLSSLTSSTAEEVVKVVAFGFDHRPYRPASPLGISLGLDIGIEVIGVQISNTFRQTLKDIGVNIEGPSYIPAAKINGSKGLPFGLDVSGSYVGYAGISIWGLGAQWSLPSSKNRVVPRVAIRGGYNRTKIILVETTTWSMDVVASMKLLLIEPYIGVGHQRAEGQISYSLPGAYQVPLTASGVYNINTIRYFIGLPFQLLFLRATVHGELNTARQNIIGLKVGLDL